MLQVSLLQRGALILSLFLLGACSGGGGGGGGGGSSSSSASSGFTLSGTISLPDTAAIDSDTNDPDQAGWASNDTALSAQSVTTPIQLLGNLNTASTGPSGKTYSAGDVLDVFQTHLASGQVIELFFAANTSGTDIDLLLLKADGSVAGYSDSSSGNRECLRITTAGDYYIIPYVYTGEPPSYGRTGAAPYTLRIGSPGESTSCANNSSSTDLFVAGQLVAKPKTVKSGLVGTLSELFGAKASPRLPELRAVPEEHMRLRAAHQALQATAEDARDKAIWRAIGTLNHAKALQASGEYDYVEPNFWLETLASYAPDDPNYLPQRWHYEQINLPSAMDRIQALSTAPTQRPIVAVIDTGIVATHPDLQAQITGGYSFISITSNGDGNTSNPDDPSSASYCSTTKCWHGSHVAGTVAALSDNNAYGAGVAKMAQIMPLRVFRPGYSATSYDVGQAILYAARLSNNSGTLPARRADVINMSLGGSGACPAQFADAITQARGQNVIVVAAAGNSASTVGTPANCTGVISVAALDASKLPTYYSNYGSSLSLAAPGGDSSQSTTGTGYPDSIYSTLASWSGGSRVASFGPMTGTSMASPHVAGVMALMRYVNPAITVAHIDTLLAQGKLTDDLGNSGRDTTTGYGLINARKAVDEALSLAAGGGSLEGIVIASPSAISFGSSLSSATLTLSITASTSEMVSSITSNHAAITITASSNVNATTRLGDYTLSVDRNQLPVGTSYPVLTVTTSTSRTFAVQLTVVKLASGSNTAASFGSVWVQASNASTGAVLARQRFNVSSGRYSWSLSGVPAGDISLIASTDVDNDRLYCEQGEACGDYPGSAQTLSITGNRSGIDFAISPTLSTSGAGSL